MHKKKIKTHISDLLIFLTICYNLSSVFIMLTAASIIWYVSPYCTNLLASIDWEKVKPADSIHYLLSSGASKHLVHCLNQVWIDKREDKVNISQLQINLSSNIKIWTFRKFQILFEKISKIKNVQN